MLNLERKMFPDGLWPVMLTPFQENSSIDYKGLEILTEYYISVGINGLFTNCLSSEMYKLTEEERCYLTKDVVNFSNGQVPVVSTGSFYRDIHQNIEFIKKIHDQGVDAVVLISSLLIAKDENEDALKRKLEIILRSTGNIPLGMYECPVPYKHGLSLKMMKWMAETGRFFYHKDTSCKADVIKEKIESVKDTPYKIFNAHTLDAFESLHIGVHGLSPISANFFPELFLLFLRSFYSRDFIRQKEINNKIVWMDYIVHQLNYPWAAKAFLRKRGLDIQTIIRDPKMKAKKSDMESLESLYSETTKIFIEFGINNTKV